MLRACMMNSHPYIPVIRPGKDYASFFKVYVPLVERRHFIPPLAGIIGSDDLQDM